MCLFFVTRQRCATSHCFIRTSFLTDLLRFSHTIYLLAKHIGAYAQGRYFVKAITVAMSIF